MLVRTKGGWARGRGGGERSWLLIKHRDQWSGALDIGEFAPLSVKNGGDFADILADDDPDIWRSERPAKAGQTGALFDRIIRQALAMKSGAKAAPARTKKSPAKRKTATKKAAAKKR